mgnify:CR=1 FL=1
MEFELTCKLSRTEQKVIKVKQDDKLCVLLDKLNLTNPSDKKAKFVYKGFTHQLASIFTFKEIGITADTTLSIVTPSRAGKIK